MERQSVSCFAHGHPSLRVLRRLFALLLIAVSSLAHADNLVGGWLSPAADNWPLIAVHAVLTPDGRVLTYGSTATGQQSAFFIYDVWDPTQGLSGGHLTLDNMTQTDIFCSSQVVLPQDGSVLISGGDNWTGTATTNTPNQNTNIFRYTDNTLTRGNDLYRARWYSTSTVLTNGEIYIQGGHSGEWRPEVRDLGGNSRNLVDADTSALGSLFPRNFVAPNGRIFGYDSNGVMYFIDPTGTGQYTDAGQFSSSYGGWMSSAAMYRPGRIITFGGNSNGAITIDINGPQPVVATTQSMSTQRRWVTATVLADGRVLATGGSRTDNQLDLVNTSAEVWDPSVGSNGQWTVGPDGSRARLYHSTALLLPDASVLVAGGGAPGPLNNLHAEIYYPSYLYNSSGGFAARPTIVSAPDSIDVGTDFSINVGTANIRRLTLVKTGSVTHSFNMDQRFLELPFSSSSGTLFVQMTDSAAEAPPGYYLMFAFDANGVPSKAKIVHVNISANPVTQVDYTPTIGGSGSTAFTLACNTNELMVGLYGNSAGTYIDRVGVQCIQMDQAGHWIGNPVNRSVTGTQTGAAFTKTCPRDSAISGFRGRSSTSVNQLDFACRTLTFAGKVSGTPQYLGAVGGAGGTAQGPFDCSTSNPVYEVSGNSSTKVDAFSMLCRPGAITYVQQNSPPTVINPGNKVGTTGTAVSLQISASDPDNDPLTYSATGLPPGLAISSTTGLISGTPTTLGTYAVTVTVTDGHDPTSVNFTWSIGSQNPLILNPMPDQPPKQVGTQITYTASTQNGINPRYKWYFDDGTQTGYSTSPSITHTYTQPTMYWVAVTATDDRGLEQTQTFSQLVYWPPTANKPAVSSNLALAAGRLWIVNQDNDSVSAFNTSNNQKLAEVSVGSAPRAVAAAPNGKVWVTNKQSSTISVIDPATMTVTSTINTGYGSQPYGLVFAPNGSAAFVALEGSGRVARLDPVSGSQLAITGALATPRHLAVSADSSRLYVSRFITARLPGEETANVSTQIGGVNVGGEVAVIDTGNLATLSTVTLRHSDDLDFENAGAGIPNYLGAPVISPDGRTAWVPSKKDNVKRGTLRSGANLNFQNTVRAISSMIDLSTSTETYGARIDHDNASLASAAAFDKYGVFLFVALETSREIAVIDANNHAEFFRINVGRAPQGLAVSADGYRLYVSNFMDRTVGVYDLTNLIDRGQWNVPLLATIQPVATEKLTATVLKGKQLFYDARDTRLSRDNYMSCATCHNDGGQDGRIWDMTGRGEGLRNTISLRGHAGMGQGFLHWTANFDEIQDFEGQIRGLAGGTGLMTDAQFNTGTRSQPLGDPTAGVSADLDALAAYVTSLASVGASPYRNPDGSMTTAGTDGAAIFQSRGCSQCHSGPNFTDSGAANLHDVGTIKQPTSGTRLGATLTGIDTPTLRGVWATAPYLHDGSAATLGDAVRAHSGVVISDSDLAKLVAYLQQLDSTSSSTTGLVAAYGFEEGTGATVLDGSGNSNTGTIQGAAVWTTQGRNGGALTFDGLDDKVFVNASNSLNLTGAMTLEAWVYPTATQGGWRTIVQKQVNAYYLHAGRSGAALRPTGGTTLNGASTYIGATSALAVNAWSHLALTYDGATRHLYVNGVEVASDVQSGTIETNSNPLWIGGNPTYGEYFKGRIDDVRVYSRALSPSEVQGDMALPVADSVPPSVSITGPTSLDTYATTTGTITLSGTASDNVAVTQVSWSNDRGGSGSATGSTAWSTSAITLQPGSNVLTVTARDVAGNTATDVVTVTYTPPDVTPPAVSIATPTAAATYSTSTSTLSLGGTASDNVGVTQVSWTNDRGGSGTATGTTAWSVATIALQSGANVLTVTARDAAGNTATDVLTVTYSPPAGDTTPPTITISSPTSGATFSTANSSVTLGGTASDNVGVTQISWSSDRGNSGTATGTTSWSTGTIGLQSGTNVLTVTVSDAAGNTSTDVLTVSYTPGIAGLVAAYGFEEGTGATVLDGSGNSNTGTIQGSAAWTAVGKHGGALTFDGLDDKVFVNASNSLNLTGAMTLEAWVYPTATQGGWRTMVQKQVNAYYLHAGRSGAALRPTGGTTLNGATTYIGATSALAVNAWSHLALTYDGATRHLYVNGVEVASDVQSGTIETNSNPLWIGGNPTYGEYFKGRIDDVRVYSRALTVSEIQSDMAAAASAP